MAKHSAPVALEVLQNARVLIDTPEKWCQEYMKVPDITLGPGGCRYCMLGAVNEVTYSRSTNGETAALMRAGLSEALGILRRAIRRVDRRNYIIANFNDTHTHAEVMSAFDAAISMAKENANV